MARETDGTPAKTAHDAVVAVALHRFAEKRRKQGERMTVQAAATIARLAGQLGIRPRLAVSELGLEPDFTLSQDELLRAFALLVGEGCREDLRKLEHALANVAFQQLDCTEPIGFEGEEAGHGFDL